MSVLSTPNRSLRVANAPCSWGVLEFDLPGEKLSYQQVLDELREAGYAATELGDWGFMPTDPAVLRNELQARELALLGAFVPIAFANESAHAIGEQVALKTARLMGAAVDQTPFIILADDNAHDPVRTTNAGRINPDQSLTKSQWDIFCRGVNRVATTVRNETGLRTVFHHHAAGYVETPSEIEALLEGTDPSLVGLCYDTGHFAFGGGDPTQGLRQFRERIWHVHFKDCNPVIHQQSHSNHWDYFGALKHGIFCELGKGNIDFKRIVAELKRSDYDGWIVVEQDVLPGMGAPKEYARLNREYLRTLGL